MKRIVLGSLLGYIFIGLTTITFHQLLYARMVPTEDSPHARYLSVITATDFVLGVLGGWLCAMVSQRARAATLALVIAGELSSIAIALLLWSAMPHLYNFVDWIIFPFAVWLGSWFVTRTVPKNSD